MAVKDLDNNLRSKLQEIADKQGVTIISFVAPQEAVRTSPVTFASASIEESEMYRIEKIVKKAKQYQSDKLHFVIHTPGGGLYPSYKIANFLRNNFSKINAFVPYEAASGGTMLCCAANELFLGELGNITPIDPQVRYQNNRVSAYAFIRAVDSIRESYGEMMPPEIPPPWQQMAEKLDPVVYDQMNTLVFTTLLVAYRLLKASGYSENTAKDIAFALTKTIYSHEYPIFAKQAADMGFSVKPNDGIMDTYAQLVSERLKEKTSNHCIDAFYPSQQKPKGKKLKNARRKSKK